MTSAITPARQPPSFGRVLLVLGATVVMASGMRALAEFGVGRAALVILGVVVINQLAEYGLDPFLLSRGLQLSPAVVFVSFTFWAWLLGAVGAFLAMPITLLLAAMFDTFPETRWLASLITTRPATYAATPSIEMDRVHACQRTGPDPGHR